MIKKFEDFINEGRKTAAGLKYKPSGSVVLPSYGDVMEDFSKYEKELLDAGIKITPVADSKYKSATVTWTSVEQAKIIRNVVHKMLKKTMTKDWANDVLHDWDDSLFIKK